MKFRHDNRGFTIVEAVVAAGVIAIVALAGVSTISQMRTMKNRSIEVCRLHAASTIEKFRSIGYFSAVSNFTPVNANRTYSGSSGLSSLGIEDSDLWPASITVLNTEVAPVVNNSILIMSSLNALLAVYNKDAAGFCSTQYGKAFPGAIAAAPLPEELKDAAVKLKIIPYDTITGVPLGSCPTDLRIAPEPQFPDAATNSAFYSPAAGGTAVEPAKARRGNTKTNVGLKLIVNETFTNEDNQTSNCYAEQNFQYPADTSPPPTPDYAAVAAVMAPPIGSNACIPQTNQYTFEFGYLNTDMEAGSVLVCRDNSVFNSYEPADPAIYRAVECRGSAVTPTVMAQSGRPLFIPDPATPGLAYTHAYEARKADLTNGWKPCDQVTVCGVAPSGAATVTGTAARPRYRIPYTNLPYLCRANIEIAALDTASNPSIKLLSTVAIPGAQTIDPRNIVTSGNFDVPSLTCGALPAAVAICGTGGLGTADWANPTADGLYFRCGGCL